MTKARYLRLLFLTIIIVINFSIAQTQTARITGKIATERGTHLKLFPDTLFFPEDTVLVNYDNSDNFFFDVPLGISANFVIPSPNDHPALGVNVMDILVIQRHILGIDTLNSIYKRIAADVTNDETITAQDLIDIRRVLIGGAPSFSNNESWVFFPPSRSVIDIQSDTNNFDFVAIKVGDVNETFFTSSTSRETPVKLLTEDIDMTKGTHYDVDIRMQSSGNLEGLQLGLYFNPTMLKLVDCTPGANSFNADNFGLQGMKDGDIRSLWFDVHGLECQKNDLLFTLRFEALEDISLSDVLSLNKENLFPMAVLDGVQKPIGLHFTPNEKAFSNSEIKLYDNYPNPFSEETTIPFYLPEARSVTLSFFNLNGILVKQIKGHHEKGRNEILIDRKSFSAGGIYYYKLDTQDFTETRKMILLD